MCNCFLPEVNSFVFRLSRLSADKLKRYEPITSRSLFHIDIMLSLAVIASLGLAAIPGHEITSLPGWEGSLPTKMYSGYIPVGNTSGTKGMIRK